MNSRREAAAACVGALVAALVLLLSVAQRWAAGHGSTAQAPIVLYQHVSGRTVAPLVAAAGIVALAGAAAIPATRARGRTVAGVLLVVSGVAAAVEALLRRDTAQGDVRKALPAGAVVDATGWPYVACVGALLLVFVGVVMTVRGARWASLSARYETGSARHPRPDDAGTWDALDRGEDPTTSKQQPDQPSDHQEPPRL